MLDDKNLMEFLISNETNLSKVQLYILQVVDIQIVYDTSYKGNIQRIIQNQNQGPESYYSN